jgi:hypothetical protein
MGEELDQKYWRKSRQNSKPFDQNFKLGRVFSKFKQIYLFIFLKQMVGRTHEGVCKGPGTDEKTKETQAKFQVTNNKFKMGFLGKIEGH